MDGRKGLLNGRALNGEKKVHRSRSGVRVGGRCGPNGEAREQWRGERPVLRENSRRLLVRERSSRWRSSNQSQLSATCSIVWEKLCLRMWKLLLWSCFFNATIVVVVLYVPECYKMYVIAGLFILLLCVFSIACLVASKQARRRSRTQLSIIETHEVAPSRDELIRNSAPRESEAGLERDRDDSCPLPQCSVEIPEIVPLRVDLVPSAQLESGAGSESRSSAPPPYNVALFYPANLPSSVASVTARTETPPPPYEVALRGT